MRENQQLGLDELMIVNPGPLGTQSLFLGEDGTLYQVHGLGEDGDLRGIGQFFLGEDHTLYQVRDSNLNGVSETAENLGEEETHNLSGYFLGADGALYEVV